MLLGLTFQLLDQVQTTGRCQLFLLSGFPALPITTHALYVHGQWCKALMGNGTGRLWQWSRAVTAVVQGDYGSDAGWLKAGRQTVVQGLPRQAGLGQTGQFWQRLHWLCRRSRSPAACLQLLVSLQNL